MKLTLSIKTLFRSPTRTILTFVLLFVVSFAFFMRMGEYAITRREINAAAKQYRGLGTAEAAPVGDMIDYEMKTSKAGSPYFIATDPKIAEAYPSEYSEEEWAEQITQIRYAPIIREQIESILGLPQISHADLRYMTSGISYDYHRRDEGMSFYDYTARCVVEATLTELQFSGGAGYRNSSTDAYERSNRLLLDDLNILTGNEQLIFGLVDTDGYMIVDAQAAKETSHKTTGWVTDGGFIGRMSYRFTPNYVYDT